MNWFTWQQSDATLLTRRESTTMSEEVLSCDLYKAWMSFVDLFHWKCKRQLLVSSPHYVFHSNADENTGASINHKSFKCNTQLSQSIIECIISTKSKSTHSIQSSKHNIPITTNNNEAKPNHRQESNGHHSQIGRTCLHPRWQQRSRPPCRQLAHWRGWDARRDYSCWNARGGG